MPDSPVPSSNVPVSHTTREVTFRLRLAWRVCRTTENHERKKRHRRTQDPCDPSFRGQTKREIDMTRAAAVRINHDQPQLVAEDARRPSVARSPAIPSSRFPAPRPAGRATCLHRSRRGKAMSSQDAREAATHRRARRRKRVRGRDRDHGWAGRVTRASRGITCASEPERCGTA